MRGSEGENEKRHHDLLALSRVSAAVSGLQNLDAILEVALDNVLSIMNGTIGGIMLLDEQTKTLSYRVSRGLSPKTIEEVCLNLGQGIAGGVAQSGKSILLEDISTDPRAAHPDIISTEVLKAFISVPLRAKETVLGVINVASHMSHHFTKHDLYLLNSIGDQVGLAIEQATLQERLRQSKEMYRLLARKIIIAREEEQGRIARELHDETTQALSGLALYLQALVDIAKTSGIADNEFQAKLGKAHSLAIHISTEVGRLIKELRPILLDTVGLVPAIRQYAEVTLGPRGIGTSMEATGNLKDLPSEVEMVLFRIAQGVISNIARHSEATNATIALEYKNMELVLIIKDNGKGFDVSKVTTIEDGGRGRGLFIMRERVALLEGTGSIDSNPGQGTTVIVRVPLIQGKANE